MRKKEGLADYRYFPEPDLPPLMLTDAEIADVRDNMPELPSQLRARLTALNLPEDVVLLLAEDVATAAYFDACVAAGADAVQAANWIQRDIMGWCKEKGVCFGCCFTDFLRFVFAAVLLTFCSHVGAESSQDAHAVAAVVLAAHLCLFSRFKLCYTLNCLTGFRDLIGMYQNKYQVY
jgi:hypothetical protein